jgi:hypothetical protein
MTVGATMPVGEQSAAGPMPGLGAFATRGSESFRTGWQSMLNSLGAEAKDAGPAQIAAGHNLVKTQGRSTPGAAKRAGSTESAERRSNAASGEKPKSTATKSETYGHAVETTPVQGEVLRAAAVPVQQTPVVNRAVDVATRAQKSERETTFGLQGAMAETSAQGVGGRKLAGSSILSVSEPGAERAATKGISAGSGSSDPQPVQQSGGIAIHQGPECDQPAERQPGGMAEGGSSEGELSGPGPAKPTSTPRGPENLPTVNEIQARPPVQEMQAGVGPVGNAGLPEVAVAMARSSLAPAEPAAETVGNRQFIAAGRLSVFPEKAAEHPSRPIHSGGLAGSVMPANSGSTGTDFTMASRGGDGSSAGRNAASVVSGGTTGTGVVNRETFASLDGATGTPTWIHVGSRSAEAGFHDPALGWVGVRADGGGGQLHAAVVPGSSDAATALGGHLSGLNAYLEEQHLHVASVTVASPEGRMAEGGTGQGGHEGMQHEGMQHGAGQGAGHDSGQDSGQGSGVGSGVASRESAGEAERSGAVSDSSGRELPLGLAGSVESFGPVPAPNGGGLHISLMA